MGNQYNKTRQNNLCVTVEKYLLECNIPGKILVDFFERMKSFQSTSSTGRRNYGDERNQITVTVHPHVIDQILQKKDIRTDTDKDLSHGTKLTVKRKTCTSLPELELEEHASESGGSPRGVVHRIWMECGKCTLDRLVATSRGDSWSINEC